MHRQRMLLSPAWQARTAPLVRILERLEVEHMAHGGKENGTLQVSYDQLEAWGVSRKSISSAIELGCLLGLITVREGERARGMVRPPSMYRLTYLRTFERGRFVAETDEWAKLSDADVSNILERFRRSSTSTGQDQTREAAA